MDGDRALKAKASDGRRTTETRVDIDAPPEAIWLCVADLEGWGAWNPLYPVMTGTAAVGERLSMAVDVPDMKRQRVNAVLTVVMAPYALTYEAKAMAGLVRARRYIKIVPDGPHSCEVVNGEQMGGLLGGLIARLVGANVRRGLEAMNLALKSRVETGR